MGDVFYLTDWSRKSMNIKNLSVRAKLYGAFGMLTVVVVVVSVLSQAACSLRWDACRPVSLN